MGKSSLKLTYKAFFVIPILAFNMPANADMTVFDPTVHGELQTVVAEAKEQLNVLQEQLDKAAEQLEFVNEISQQAKATTQAIGEMTSITLPSLNLGKLASQIKKDVQCLMPDLEEMLPDITFKDLEWSGVCNASTYYKSALFTPDETEGSDEEGGAMTGAELRQLKAEVQNRRMAIYQDTVLKGIAGGDIGVKSSTELMEATEELQQAAEAAETMNTRLAVIAQGLVLQARGTAQTNQLLAQMLKLQSMVAITAGMPIDQVQAALEQDGEDQ